MSLVQVVLGVFLLSLTLPCSESTEVICYTLSWSQYKQEPAKFTMDMVPGHLCDQVIYSFYGIDSEFKIKELDPTDHDNLKKLVQVKEKNPGMKVLVAIGGWSASAGFPPMAASRANRAIFIRSVMEFIEKNGIDGIDIDWEFPTAAERGIFVDLCRELKEAFGGRYILSAAFSVGGWAVDQIYDVTALSSSLDHFGIMSYDMAFCGSGAPLEHQSPLFASATTTQPELEIAKRLEYYVKKGADRNKMVLGLAFYGRGSTISKDSAKIGDNVANGCIIGPYTSESGFRAYYEICQGSGEGMHRVWDDSAKVPIATGSNKWIGYDDEQSLVEKVNFAKEKQYKGVMIWAIDFDDIKGQLCGGAPFPLLTKVHEAAKSGETGTTATTTASTTTASTTTAPTTKTTTGTTTQSSTTSSSNSTGGSKRCACDKPLEPNYDNDCKSFFFCSEASGAEQNCPPGLQFSFESQACDYPSNVRCTKCGS